ncbi:alpha-E domain-containing protein [Aliiglaciecola sp. LCG003]|uniref:alpha-E domain-containing protein n=1 Tax=Aliiglaciecola sp. LCG003 TaxID=3053655 RepID=UPI002572AB92|nr:alpha-E domain-containing protein [Aliiglaciecola sp. LCG003]WJG07975.1 alpha-E domain-containing protein [Aliiglaciecola sp. LCG003]
MLSRVANNLCWLGRYLERAENTARLINVNFNLLLDLPKSIELGWEPIVDIISNREQFYQNYEDASERNVVNFLVADSKNFGSIVNSLNASRENARTIREIIPREAWEQINELYLYAKENNQKALSRRSRYDFLSEIIQANQTITGILSGTMTYDEGYQFLLIGRNLERADMTTRIIDVRSATLLPDIETEQSAFENLQWMSVLKSLTAYQMYRREMRLRIRRSDVLKFLLLEERFPRALMHTLKQVEVCLRQLPNYEASLNTLSKVEQQLLDANPQLLIQDKLHEFIDDMQLGLMEIFDQIQQTYF